MSLVDHLVAPAIILTRKRTLDLMNYLSNARHFIFVWLVLSLILALSIPLLLRAEQENTASTSVSPLVNPWVWSAILRSTAPPPASLLPKQLIIFVHAIPGFMGHSYGGGNSTHRDELF